MALIAQPTLESKKWSNGSSNIGHEGVAEADIDAGGEARMCGGEIVAIRGL